MQEHRCPDPDDDGVVFVHDAQSDDCVLRIGCPAVLRRIVQQVENT